MSLELWSSPPSFTLIFPQLHHIFESSTLNIHLISLPMLFILNSSAMDLMIETSLVLKM